MDEARRSGSSPAGRCAALILAVGLVSTAYAAPARDDATLRSRANEFLGLTDSNLVTLDIDRTPGVTRQVSVPIAGRMRVLLLAPHSNRAAGYRIKAQVADGSLVDVEPGPVRTVRGTVIGEEGVVVAGAVDDRGLSVMVRLADGQRFWVEPLFKRIDGATPDQHVVYSDADVILGGRSCATEVDHSDKSIQNDGAAPEGPTLGCDGLPCEVELACDADVEFHNIWGSVAAVEGRINNIMNIVNVQYERDVGITHRITFILVRTAEPDPYDIVFGPGDCGELLNQFRSEWLANQQAHLVDEHQLFTGKSLSDCAGIAFTIGGICTSNAFCVVDNEVGFPFATDVTAHELGHLWGGVHCDCVNPAYTMNTFLTGANRFNPDLNIPLIVFHRETRTCLESTAPPTTLPFFDSFDGPGVDLSLWHNAGASVDNLGINEPSGTTSLRLNGTDRLTSGFIDATGAAVAGVDYWWQRTGNTGGSPENNEDLVLEYKAVDGNWIEADRQLGDPGGGGDNLPYERACVVLPEDTDLSILQIRYRLLGAESADNFFIDDVSIVDGADILQVTAPPVFDCACDGGAAEFSVEAVGEPPLSYQWNLNGTPIAGATDPTLVISPVDAGDFGDYSVEVGNGCGASLTTQDVVLLEATQPVITAPPTNTTVPPGGTLSLFVVGAGECVEFQWFFNDEPIANAGGSFLFIPNMQCADQGCYTVELFNDCGSVVSDVAEVLVTGCGPLECNADSTPPEIVHGLAQQGETRPFSGYIDPRNESSNGADLDRGITEVAILFSEPVDNVGGGPLTADAFSVTETGAAAPPEVTGVDTAAMPLVVLTLSRPLTLQEWTTIRASVQDQAETPNVIVNNGDLGPGMNEPDRVDIGFLPADVDQSGGVNPLDLLKFKQLVNGVQTPDIGTLADFIDTNRDGIVNPLDLLSFKQLINGVTPPATMQWALESMNSSQP